MTVLRVLETLFNIQWNMQRWLFAGVAFHQIMNPSYEQKAAWAHFQSKIAEAEVFESEGFTLLARVDAVNALRYAPDLPPAVA